MLSHRTQRSEASHQASTTASASARNFVHEMIHREILGWYINSGAVLFVTPVVELRSLLVLKQNNCRTFPNVYDSTSS